MAMPTLSAARAPFAYRSGSTCQRGGGGVSLRCHVVGDGELRALAAGANLIPAALAAALTAPSAGHSAAFPPATAAPAPAQPSTFPQPRRRARAMSGSLELPAPAEQRTHVCSCLFMHVYGMSTLAVAQHVAFAVCSRLLFNNLCPHAPANMAASRCETRGLGIWRRSPTAPGLPTHGEQWAWQRRPLWPWQTDLKMRTEVAEHPEPENATEAEAGRQLDRSLQRHLRQHLAAMGLYGPAGGASCCQWARP